MELFFRETGEGAPLIIIHGLYGCSDNWLTIARKLSPSFHVYTIDLRNHGQSPHAESHTYDDMVADLLEFISAKGFSTVTLLGHSMGGKVAMRFTLQYPHKVKQLIVADIAPKNYLHMHNRGESANQHEKIIDALLAINLTGLSTRKDIDNALKNDFPEMGLRQFLVKNIRKGKDNKMEWCINLPVLRASLPDIMDGFSNTKTSCNTPTLFVKGENSPYIDAEDSYEIHNYFPNSNTASIPNAAHWLHAEQPELFFNTIMYFLE